MKTSTIWNTETICDMSVTQFDAVTSSDMADFDEDSD